MTEVTTQQNKEQLLHFMYGFDEYAYADPSPYYPEIEAIRTGQFTDVLIDCAGIAVGVLAVRFWTHRRG